MGKHIYVVFLMLLQTQEPVDADEPEKSKTDDSCIYWLLIGTLFSHFIIMA